MWLLASVHQVMFLEVSQLSETLFTHITLEWSLTTVHSQMDLQ